MTRTSTELSTSGFVLVDGQLSARRKTALKVARDLKGRFPMLQVKIYDAEEKRSEEIELAAA